MFLPWRPSSAVEFKNGYLDLFPLSAGGTLLSGFQFHGVLLVRVWYCNVSFKDNILHCKRRKYCNPVNEFIIRLTAVVGEFVSWRAWLCVLC